MGAIYSLSQSNLLINGSSTKGIVKEFSIDNLEFNTETYDPIGKLGQQDIPVGIKQVTSTLTFAGPNPDFFNNVAFAWATTPITILGVMVNNNISGANANAQFECDMVVRPVEVGLGDYASQKLTEYERKVCVDYVRIVMDGVEQLVYDQQNDIYSVLGVDQWAAWRQTLGE